MHARCFHLVVTCYSEKSSTARSVLLLIRRACKYLPPFSSAAQTLICTLEIHLTQSESPSLWPLTSCLLDSANMEWYWPGRKYRCCNTACMCLCFPRLSKKIHMRPSRFKLVFFVPKKSSRIVLDHLFLRFPNDLGMIGKYEQCAFIQSGIGWHLSLIFCICFSYALMCSDTRAIRAIQGGTRCATSSWIRRWAGTCGRGQGGNHIDRSQRHWWSCKRSP